MAKCVIIKGTGTGVGKSLLVTALCRIYTRKGYRVAPFQACNISLKSHSTCDGGEIGISQVLQAEAASVEPIMHMNPVLLKPNDEGLELIIHGESHGIVKDTGFYHDFGLGAVRESFNFLNDEFDIVFVESSGEDYDFINGDVILIGDSFSDVSWDGVVGVVVNTLSVFDGEVDVPVCGVLPYDDALILPDEGAYSMRERRLLVGDKSIVVGVVNLPSAANFTDMDPFDFEDDVAIKMLDIDNPDCLDDVDLIIIPGTRSTTDDARSLMDSGMGDRIIEKSDDVPVIGICGGYQILGNSIQDKNQADGDLEFVKTLGLLDIDTDFEMDDRVVCDTKACFVDSDNLVGLAKVLFSGMGGSVISGYELHKGNTYIGGDGTCPLFVVSEGLGNNQVDVFDGACGEGNVLGTYLHGIFDNSSFRDPLLNYIRGCKGLRLKYDVDSCYGDGGYSLDKLVGVLEACLDMVFVDSLVVDG